MLVFVFPGQGSQKRGMGAELFDSVAEFAAVENEVNRLLGYSLRELCLNDTDNKLRQTQYTQPCLYTVNALSYYKARAEGKKPAMVAGHSLGEYNALLAAGAFDFLTGLRLVKKRGELMSQASDGAMAAIIGLGANEIQSTLDREGFGGIDVANYNSPTQTVISGSPDDIKNVSPALEAAGAQMCIPLPVSAAFHSRYMVDAGQAFEDYLGQFTFNSLQLPVVSNVTGQFYPDTDPTTIISSLLVRQISESVRWVQSIRFLSAQGATNFEEVGPGMVLARLIQQIRS